MNYNLNINFLNFVLHIIICSFIRIVETVKMFKKIIIISVILLISVVLISLANLSYETNNILDNYNSIFSNKKYDHAVLIDNVTVIKQNVTCGYAVIEMFAKWTNETNITEETLYKQYDGVVTSTGKSFEEEMNKQFPQYNTTMHTYLKNTELIDKVYTSLSKGIPVPFEWAAKYEGEWTLHYSLIIGMDIKNDKVIIANPYGYIEKISLKEFLDRTSFESYEDMPIYLKLGFAFGIFEKNTIFIVEPKRHN